MKKIKGFIFLTAMIHFGQFLSAQQTNEKLVTETRYLLYLPGAYQTDTTERWPLLIFLHGSGESGTDLSKVKFHGPPQLIEQGKQFPFIVVSPQSDVPNGWDIEALYRLMQSIKKNYRVDVDRIYLTGLSMGGFGTWKLAMAHPEEFAALAPICGGGDTTEAWKLRNIPVWCFHGAQDQTVNIAGSVNMVNAATRYNNNVHFTIYADKNHNSWDTTYNSSDTLYTWLLKQKKFHYQPKQIKPSILQKYAGWYLGPDGDTVRIQVKPEGLAAYVGTDTSILYSAEENLFYFRPNLTMDVRFVKTGGNVSGFLFLADRKLWYRRIKK